MIQCGKSVFKTSIGDDPRIKKLPIKATWGVPHTSLLLRSYLVSSERCSCYY